MSDHRAANASSDLREPDGRASRPSAGRPGRSLSAGQRWLVLGVAFLGWMFAGWEISLFALITRPAMLDLLRGRAESGGLEAEVGRWFAWYQCAFLLGAAAGGWLFGWLGDRVGRTRALGASILCY